MSYNIKDLNDDYSDYTEFLETDNGMIIYNIFVNPKKETVCINNHNVAIDVVKSTDGTKIGFWCFQTEDKKIIIG